MCGGIMALCILPLPRQLICRYRNFAFLCCNTLLNIKTKSLCFFVKTALFHIRFLKYRLLHLQSQLEPNVRTALAALHELPPVLCELEHLQVRIVVQGVQHTQWLLSPKLQRLWKSPNYFRLDSDPGFLNKSGSLSRPSSTPSDSWGRSCKDFEKVRTF